MSTAFHPQTDDQTKHVNQELEQYLRIYMDWHQDDWQEWIAIMEFAYNDKKHTAMGYTPFFIKYGQHPNMGTEKLKRQTTQQSRTSQSE
jgi:hypothetical protein